MSGLFRKVEIPEEVLLEFLKLYEEDTAFSENPRNLEKIILQLDFTRVTERVKIKLLPICKKNCLISALQVIEGEKNESLRKLYDLYVKLLKDQE